jgi:hypothetical protein
MATKLCPGAAARIGAGAEIAAQPQGGDGAGVLNPGAHDKRQSAA